MGEGYRSKGSIGFIVPPRCNETLLEEAFRIRPPGLTWCIATLGLGEFGKQDFEAALEMTETAAKELALRKVSVIVQTGLPLQVAGGPKYYEELKVRLQAAVGDHIPVEPDASVVLKALDALGAKRVSVITPYQEWILEDLVRMIAAHDLEVVSAKGEELKLAEIITHADSDSVYRKAMESFQEQPDTDAFYLSCPQWPNVGSIERIERETGKPVVTQLTATMWWAITTLGFEDKVTGYGCLLEGSTPEVQAASTQL